MFIYHHLFLLFALGVTLFLYPKPPFEAIAHLKKHLFTHINAKSEVHNCTAAGVWEDAVRKGTAEKSISLSDWDCETVERLIGFTYAGTYKFPELVLGEDGGAKDPGTKDTNALLVHAKVYTLAQYIGVKELQWMALDRLRTALGRIEGRILGGTPRVAADIIELLGYVYSHTYTGSYMNPEEPMRGLVLAFAAGNVENFMDREELQILLSAGGSFAVELMEKMTKRLLDTKAHNLGKKLQEMQLSLWESEVEVMFYKERNMEIMEELEAADQRVMGLDRKVWMLAEKDLDFQAFDDQDRYDG